MKQFCKYFNKRSFFYIMIGMLPFFADAQKRTVYGYVLDSTSYSPITGAKITNVYTNKSVVSNNRGQFQIIASPGDGLFFTAADYHFRQLNYSMLQQDTILIYLGRLPHELPGVTVYAEGYSRYQQDSIKRLGEFNEQMVSPQYAPVSRANSQAAGVGISLDYLSKREKSKRRAKKLFDEQEKDAYVHFRFSPELVAGYTGLQGDSLQSFRMQYYPDYDWLRAHRSDEDVLYYINEKLKLFYSRKEKK